MYPRHIGVVRFKSTGIPFAAESPPLVQNLRLVYGFSRYSWEMNTKLLMTASSVFLGVTGLATTFAPAELLASLKIAPTEPLPVIIQLLGALYLGFALTNWMAKDSLIGGIYARPLSIGNCVNFVAGGLALFKHQSATGFQSPLTIVFVFYAVFAVAFTWLIFGRGVACRASAR